MHALFTEYEKTGTSCSKHLNVKPIKRFKHLELEDIYIFAVSVKLTFMKCGLLPLKYSFFVQLKNTQIGEKSPWRRL